MAKNDKDTIRELKAITRGQQKELARLRKELDRRQDVGDDYQELLLESDSQKHATRTATESPKCPKCSGKINSSPIGKYTLIQCTQCEWRKRQ